MNREIRFRAQTQPKSRPAKWVYGDFFSQYKDGVTSYYIVEHPNGRDSGREIMWPINPDTLGVYTGLKDKNGVEIYEFDLAEHRNYIGELLGRYEVRWGHFGFTLWDEKQPDVLSRYISPNQLEVIGSRFDNSELLKEDQ